MAPQVYQGFQHPGSSPQCMLISSFINNYLVGALPIIVTCMGSGMEGPSLCLKLKEIRHDSHIAVYFLLPRVAQNTEVGMLTALHILSLHFICGVMGINCTKLPTESSEKPLKD